jgi:hypothetical protein
MVLKTMLTASQRFGKNQKGALVWAAHPGRLAGVRSPMA